MNKDKIKYYNRKELEKYTFMGILTLIGDRVPNEEEKEVLLERLEEIKNEMI